MSSPIYLDNSSQGKPSAKVVAAMMPHLTTYFGNSLSPHQKGQEAHSSTIQHIKNLYTFLGADEEDTLVVTSSGAEAICHVFSSVYRDVTLTKGKNHFLTSKTDEAASILTAASYEIHGCQSKTIDIFEKGVLRLKEVIESLSPRTALVSLSWGCGLTGLIQPIAEIASLCKERGIRFHLDATHIMGKLFYELEDIQPDYLTLDGSAIHAPKGSGLLLIKKGIKTAPFIFGSPDQGGMRGGGINTASLAGLSVAIQESIQYRDFLCTETARLRSKLEKGICEQIKEAQICFVAEERLPSCTTIIFPGICNEALLFALNKKNIFASIGGGNFQQLSLLLQARGIEKYLSHSAISFSLSRETTEEEIDHSIAIIVETVSKLKNLSRDITFDSHGALHA